jgi:hypothetical protein
MFSRPLPMPPPDAVWTVLSGPVPFGRALEGLDDSELTLVRRELAEATAEFSGPDGTYMFPMAFRLFWGRK